MRLAELLREQADPRRVVVSYLISKRLVINEHLLLVLAFDPAARPRNHWKGELSGEMATLASMRMAWMRGKPPIPQKLYVQHLWDGPFGGTEEETMREMLDRLVREKPEVRRNDKTIPDLIDEVRAWHVEAGRRIGHKEDIRAWVAAL